MASSSQSSAARGPLSLSLSKLSYSIAPTLKSKIVWTHLPAQHDMFVVFDSLRQAVLGGIMERKVLKLVHDGDVLDEIDLRILEHQAANAKSLERQEFQSSQGTYPSIALIINKPLVALRFELPDGQIRRLQFKFKEDSAYYSAVQVFESLGLPINDKNPADPVVPTHHQSSSQSANTVLSSNDSQDYRSISRGSISFVPTINPISSSDVTSRATTFCGDEVQPASSAPETSAIRPFTAPCSLSQMLPPKRILPFPIKITKPPIQAPETDSSLLSKTSSEVVKNPVATTVTKKSRMKKTPLQPLPPEAGPKKTTGVQTSTPSSESLNAFPNTEATYTPSTPEQPSNIPELSSSGNHLLQKPTTRPKTAPKATLPTSLPDPPTNTTTLPVEIQPADFIARLDQWVRSYQPATSPNPPAPNLTDLVAYAAQSREDRITVIDDMLCECLGDENFLKLVEDVDQSWRRIGLGL